MSPTAAEIPDNNQSEIGQSQMDGQIQSPRPATANAISHPSTVQYPTLGQAAYSYPDPYYRSLYTPYETQPYPTQPYAVQPMVHHQLMGIQHGGVPLPSDTVEEPVFVNAKQYHCILRRRRCRAKAESENKVHKSRKMQRVGVSSQQVAVQKLGDSQMTLSPKFKLAAMQSRLLDPFVETELSLRGDPLVPGLPDDIALNCLLRLPVASHAAGKSVCKRWYQLFGSKERFFTRRKEMGFQDPWLFIFAFHKCTGKIQWHVLDLHVAVGCISRTNGTEKSPSFLVHWQVVVAPEAFSNLTPSSTQVLFA